MAGRLPCSRVPDRSSSLRVPPRVRDPVARVAIGVALLLSSGCGLMLPGEPEPTPRVTDTVVTRAPRPSATRSAPQISDPDAWVAEACAAYGGFRADAKAIVTANPLPQNGTLDSSRSIHLLRLRRILPLYEAVQSRLSALPALADLEPLGTALVSWARDARALDVTYRDTVRSAASLDALRASHADWDAAGTRLMFRLYDSVALVAPAGRSALAAYDGDCEELPLEAAGVPTPREIPEFDDVAITENFAEIPVWYADTFQGGRAEQVEGEYRVTVTDPAGSGWWVNTELTHQPARFGDVRVETVLTVEGPTTQFTSAGGGLICRDSGGDAASAYVAVVRSYGTDPREGAVLLVWEKNPEYSLVARRTLSSLDIGQVELALTCIGGTGDSPVTLALDVDGSRVLEWIDETPIAAEGFVGMLATSTSRASMSFEEITVRVP